jgi:hypothetical protein
LAEWKEGRAICRFGGKSCLYDEVRRLLAGSGFGGRRGRIGTDQVEFTAIQEFPLNLFAGFKPMAVAKASGKLT